MRRPLPKQSSVRGSILVVKNMKKEKKKLFEGVDFREFVTKLHENDYSAWELLNRHMRNYKKHCLYMLYDHYGYSEMRCREIKPECEAVMDLATVEVVADLVYDEELTNDQNKGRIIKFLHIHVKSALKRFVEKENGVYSKYYAWLYVHMRKKGLDLWTSPDEELAISIQECGSCKKPLRTLEKLRKYYAQRHEDNTVPIENLDSYHQYDVTDDVEFRVILGEFKKYVGELRYKLFYDYFVDPTKYTYKSLGIKYGILPYKVEGLIREARLSAIKFFNYDGEQAEFVSRTTLRAAASFADTHESLSLEELVAISE